MKKILAHALALVLLLVGVTAPVSSQAAENDTTTYTIIVREVYLKPIYDYSILRNSEDDYSYNVNLHCGVNGWNDIQDLQMTKNVIRYNGDICDVEYKADVTVKKEDVIDFAVYVDRSSLNEQSQWYNNNGQDYHVSRSITSSNNFYVNCKSDN